MQISDNNLRHPDTPEESKQLKGEIARYILEREGEDYSNFDIAEELKIGYTFVEKTLEQLEKEGAIRYHKKIMKLNDPVG